MKKVKPEISKTRKVITFILLAPVWLVMSVYFLGWAYSDTEYTAKQLHEITKGNAQLKCQIASTRKLKFPSTANFDGQGGFVNNGKNWTIKQGLYSKNSFGGNVHSVFVCDIKNTAGTDVKLISIYQER